MPRGLDERRLPLPRGRRQERVLGVVNVTVAPARRVFLRALKPARCASSLSLGDWSCAARSGSAGLGSERAEGCLVNLTMGLAIAARELSLHIVGALVLR